ncbi:MAG: hypothetical protein ACC619_07995, partial [Paracoccaceae bacterium]
MVGRRVVMAQLFHIQTVTVPFQPYGADIWDISLSVNGGAMTLSVFAGDNASARLVNFDVSGTLNYTDQNFLGATTDGFISADYGSITLNLSAMRLGAVLDVLPGEMRDATTLTSLNSGAVNDMVSLLATSIGGNSFVISSRPDAPGIALFQQMTDGTLNAITPTPDTSVGKISDLATFNAYGSVWIVAASSDQDNVQSFSQDASGSLSAAASFGAVDGLGINTPTALSPVYLNGQPYVVLASADTGSLSVLRLEADGSFSVADHVLDDLNTRFDDTSVVQTVTVGDAVFVLAAGSDDGFTLFRLRPDGKLFQLESYADTAATTLNNVSAAALEVDGSTLRIFLSSATETGISHFSYGLSALGTTFIGARGGVSLTGTALDDMILGGAGDDSLAGGAGPDIIIDGAGS